MSDVKKRPPYLLYVVLIVIVLAIVLMSMFKPKEEEKPVAKEKPQVVSILQVALTNVEDVVVLPAMIMANMDATLSAETAGQIVALEVDRGDHVQAGQLLMQIDDRVWQADFAAAQIALRDATNNFNRFKTLRESGAVSASEYEAVERQKVDAGSMLTSASIQIENCKVTAPMDGVINERYVELGEYVQPGMPIFQVIDYSRVKVNLQIPERDIYAIALGDRLSFSLQPLPGKLFEGEITFVAVQADPRNNSFRAELTVENAGHLLRPGMIAQVQFKRGEQFHVVVLPIGAVLPSKGDHIVYLMKDGQAVRRKVMIEKITKQHVIISGGLEVGDRVILEGNRTLSDGQLVVNQGK